MLEFAGTRAARLSSDVPEAPVARPTLDQASALESADTYGFSARRTIAWAPNEAATSRVSELELPAK
jgi:hypothetical protein